MSDERRGMKSLPRDHLTSLVLELGEKLGLLPWSSSLPWPLAGLHLSTSIQRCTLGPWAEVAGGAGKCLWNQDGTFCPYVENVLCTPTRHHPLNLLPARMLAPTPQRPLMIPSVC